MDAGETTKFAPEIEQLQFTTHITHASIHTSPEVGRIDDCLTYLRVIPDGREDGVVYARTLAADELDTGETIRVKPGEKLVFREGSISINVDIIDKSSIIYEDGYSPITNVVWTWLTFLRSEKEPGALRFILAACRRLDASHKILSSIWENFHKLEHETLNGIQIRVTIYETIGLIESFFVSLNRAVQMSSKLTEMFGLKTEFPHDVRAKLG